MFSNFKNVLFHKNEKSTGSYIFIPITRVKPKKKYPGVQYKIYEFEEGKVNQISLF